MSGRRGAALVTGASRGLGAVIARHLAAHGWTVAVNYRAGAERARDAVDQIASAGGVAEMFAADGTSMRRRPIATIRCRSSVGSDGSP